MPDTLMPPATDARTLARELSGKQLQANMSYGGVKQSGLGKEASLEAMLEHFTTKKTIILNLG